VIRIAFSCNVFNLPSYGISVYAPATTAGVMMLIQTYGTTMPAGFYGSWSRLVDWHVETATAADSWRTEEVSMQSVAGELAPPAGNS